MLFLGLDQGVFQLVQGMQLGMYGSMLLNGSPMSFHGREGDDLPNG